MPLIPTSAQNEVDQALRDLIKNAGIPIRDVAVALDISPSECWKWWTGQAHLPLSSKLANLKINWGLDLDNLVHSEVDFRALRKKLFQVSDLPESYAINPLSFVASSRHILDMIKVEYGALTLNRILLDLGVSPSYFDNLNNRISLKFFIDILDKYVELGNTTQDFNRLSKALFITVEETDLQKCFPVCESYEEAYEYIKSSTHKFDRNFDYHFSISSKNLQLFCKPSEELQETIKDSSINSSNLFKYRSYLFGNMPYLCGLEPIAVKTRSCISQGDTFCHYEMEFPKNKILRHLQPLA